MGIKFKGKALELFDRMSAEDSEVYENFKADILCRYEPVIRSLPLAVQGWDVTPTSSVLAI